MLSKTLSFNQTLFRKNLTRFWPLWAVPSFVGALFPLAFLTQQLQYPSQIRPLDVTAVYYEVVTYGLPVLSLCYAVLVALAVWSYLFNARSVGLMHTLPLRREGIFFTSFLSGMAMLLIPYAVTGALATVIFACFGAFNPGGILVTIACVVAESLFYFSTATLVAFITGNLFAMPVLYFIFHFLAAGMDLLISVFAGGFLFGVSAGYTGVVEYLSPTVYLLSHVRTARESAEVFVSDPIHGYMTDYGMGYMNYELTDVGLENGWLIAVYACVGVVLLALSWWLYSRRRSESAGDVVAVQWMKPLFRYGITICGAMLGGLALYSVFWGGFQRSNYFDVVPLTVFMLMAGLLSYFAASMLLAKSFRVFRGCWRGVGMTALCVAVLCGTLHFDLLGVETRVPRAAEIESLEFRAADNTYLFTPEGHGALLERVREVHAAIAADADYVIDMDENWRYTDSSDWENVSTHNQVRLLYTLKNGTQVSRRYYVPITRERLQRSDTYDYLLNELVNSEAMKIQRLHLADDYVPEGGSLWLEGRNAGLDLSSREAVAILEAVGRDMAEGHWGDYNWFNEDSGARLAIGLDLSFRRDIDEEYSDFDYINIALWPEMRHTAACLRTLGLAQAEDFVTYAQLHPEAYADELLEKYDAGELTSFPTSGQVIYDSGAASIGIIGGADGPTEVFVTAG